MNNPQSEETRSYRNIFKATTLFGGVQVYQILINVIRSKFVAVLLGTAGMGIQGMLQSSLSLVQSFTSLGLCSSAIRDVSEANGSGDMERIGRAVHTVRRLTWLTGLLGMVAVILFSPLLSKTSFGNSEYILPLILLSCIPLIDQLGGGNAVILQGMRRLKDLAKASAIGATLGLLISVPIYYVWGVKGIVPTLILASLAGFCINAFFAHKISLPRPVMTTKEVWTNGKVMMKMGLALSFTGIVSTAVNYALRSYIMRQGGADSVGLYQAGFTIITTYVGMVFTAIGGDFYPRLAAVNTDNSACRLVISQQGEIATQILAPILCICALTMPLIVKILYSTQFLDACPIALWCCPGMMLRLASWLIAFQFVAKAESTLFIITETISGLFTLIVRLLGFKWFGLAGLGIGFSITYVFYLILVYVIAKKRYGFSFSNSFVRAFLLQTVLVLGSMLTVSFVFTSVKYWLCGFLTLVSCLYAVIMLERKMGLVKMLRDFLKQ